MPCNVSILRNYLQGGGSVVESSDAYLRTPYEAAGN